MDFKLILRFLKMDASYFEVNKELFLKLQFNLEVDFECL